MKSGGSGDLSGRGEGKGVDKRRGESIFHFLNCPSMLLKKGYSKYTTKLHFRFYLVQESGGGGINKGGMNTKKRANTPPFPLFAPRHKGFSKALSRLGYLIDFKICKPLDMQIIF